MNVLQPYPEYRNCDRRWLTSIPSEWQFVPMKHLVKFQGGGTPSKDVLTYWGGDIPWVSPKDMKSRFIKKTQDSITVAGLNNSTSSLISVGSLLMVVRSGILQHTIPVAINTVEVSLNQDMKALLTRGRLHIPYATYVIQGVNDALLLEWAKQGATVESIAQEYLANTEFPLPSMREQQKIATFLDHETAKIDTLIEKQQQLIKLLKEKRQAVISHAVTKGLNPDVPMRDSGVEWLGQVPEGWRVAPLKYLVRFTGGGTPNKDVPAYWGGGIPWISPKDMKSSSVCDSIDRITNLGLENSSASLVDTDSLLMVVRSGILQHTIPVAINTVEVTLNQDMKALKSNGELIMQYAFYVIVGNNSKLLQEWAKPGATVESIEQEYLATAGFPLPSYDEQINIIGFLTSNNLKFEKLIQKVELQVNLLTERKKTLISAAVTGEIDIRNWQPPTPATDTQSKDAQTP